MDHIICPLEIKADTDDGTITGYGSVFGNVDSYGDTVAKGAFAKSIAEVKSGAKSWPAMLLQHGDETAQGKMPIGIWLDMSEDSHGLRLKGKLANTKRGCDTYALLEMKPRPALNGLSIGFRCTDYELHKAGSPARRTIKGVDLVEVSLVTFPANLWATITSVKAEVEAKPEFSMRDLAKADFDMLRRLTNTNRIGR
jgi:HK97 family phage prohead protease